MPRKVFVAGEILTASDVNTNLMDQAVMVFDDATARATAIPTPVEGMVTYLKDTNLVQAFTGSAFTAVGGILQVVSTTKTDIFTASVNAATLEPVTGLSVSITPSSTTSKILVTGFVSLGGLPIISRGIFVSILRDSSVIGLGGTAGDRQRVHSGANAATDSRPIATASINFLDTPSTDSSVTYSVSVSHTVGVAQTVLVNRAGDDSDINQVGRAVSTITVMEVAV